MLQASTNPPSGAAAVHAPARPAFAPEEIAGLLERIRQPAHIVSDPAGHRGVLVGPSSSGGSPRLGADYRWLGTLPPLYPEWLGDRSFCEAHATRFPYVAGAMANGIATPQLVVATARAGMIGFFGAGGLSLGAVEAGIDAIQRELGGELPNWGANLIHAPNEPELERRTAELYLQRRVPRVSASAYMKLTPAIVRYAAGGLSVDAEGRIVRRSRVLAKISRPEVARLFIAPPPDALLRELVAAGELSELQAQLASRVPLAEDITVEADSGGHTDNRPLGALLPVICALRDELCAQHGWQVRVGAAGGLGTPGAVASAFALGAAYVLTGSINQAAVESGLSAAGKQLLAEAGVADVVMAPSPDMFELGVKVQVLARGTLFARRAARLYALYREHDSLERLPAAVVGELERDVFRAPLDEVWRQTRDFWRERNPAELARAERSAKHRMALVFRWYVGQSSRWAIAGDAERRLDYQIWCGPALGAFNAWARGSFLEHAAGRSVVQIGKNLLEGAAVISRAQQLRSCGVPVATRAFDFRPRPLG